MNTDGAKKGDDGVHGFRVQPCGLPRNDKAGVPSDLRGHPEMS